MCENLSNTCWKSIWIASTIFLSLIVPVEPINQHGFAFCFSYLLSTANSNLQILLHKYFPWSLFAEYHLSDDKLIGVQLHGMLSLSFINLLQYFPSCFLAFYNFFCIVNRFISTFHSTILFLHRFLSPFYFLHFVLRFLLSTFLSTVLIYLFISVCLSILFLSFNIFFIPSVFLSFFQHVFQHLYNWDPVLNSIPLHIIHYNLSGVFIATLIWEEESLPRDLRYIMTWFFFNEMIRYNEYRGVSLLTPKGSSSMIIFKWSTARHRVAK